MSSNTHKAVPNVNVSAYAMPTPQNAMPSDELKPCVNRSNEANGSDTAIYKINEAGMIASGLNSAPFKNAVTNIFFDQAQWVPILH